MCRGRALWYTPRIRCHSAAFLFAILVSLPLCPMAYSSHTTLRFLRVHEGARDVPGAHVARDSASPDRARALGEGHLAQVVRPPRGRRPHVASRRGGRRPRGRPRRRHRRGGRAGRGGPRSPGRRHELGRHHRHGSALRRGLHLGRRRHPGPQEGEARRGRQGQDHLVLQQEVHGGHHRQGRRLCPRPRSGEDCLRVQHLAFV